MTVGNIDVETTSERVQDLIAEEKEMSPALKSILEVLLLLVPLLTNRLGLNRNNSRKLHSADPYRAKKAGNKNERQPEG